MAVYKLSYRHRNTKGGCPFFVDEEEYFSNRGAAEHRAEELEAEGALIIKVAEERKSQSILEFGQKTERK